MTMSSLPCTLYVVLWICLSHHWIRVTSDTSTQPNIIFMLGDDLGFNEFGYHGCTDTQTPFINQLVQEESLILMNNYVQKVCSPTRAAFLTGRYPSHLGLQNYVFDPQIAVSLTRQVSTLSNEFKHNGYSTHIIGKWHLGYQSWEYTPRYRGFDSFAGFYGGWQDYYTHKQTFFDDAAHYFYDLRENEDECVDDVEEGIYGVYWERDKTLALLKTLKLRTKPFFLYLAWQAAHAPDDAPQEYVDLYATQYPSHTHHVVKQAQITILDESINSVITYLKENDMWENTLLVFTSDNGGNHLRGDNYPLRGFKNASWEGGIRVPAFVSGGYLNEDRRGQILSDVMVHITDWYPTLLSAAGLEIQYINSRKLHGKKEDDMRFAKNGVGKIDLDGKNVWDAIQFGTINDAISMDSREVLLDLNSRWCVYSSCGAIRIGKYKFLRGDNIGSNNGIPDGDHWGRDYATCDNDEDGTNIIGCDTYVDSDSVGCHVLESGCLFNIEEDPCEYTNLVDVYPDVAQHMIHRLDWYQHKAADPLIRKEDSLEFSAIDPQLKCDGMFWCPFQTYDEAEFEEKLSEKYKELYPVIEPTTDEKQEKEDDAPLLVLMIYVGLLFISVIAIVYVNNSGHATNSAALWAKYRKHYENLRNETVPLVQ